MVWNIKIHFILHNKKIARTWISSWGVWCWVIRAKIPTVSMASKLSSRLNHLPAEVRLEINQVLKWFISLSKKSSIILMSKVLSYRYRLPVTLKKFSNLVTIPTASILMCIAHFGCRVWTFQFRFYADCLSNYYPTKKKKKKTFGTL